jgi:hypothetical protein
MAYLICPANDLYVPINPITLEIGEVEDYDFVDSAAQIYKILDVLKLSNLISRVPYDSPEEVVVIINSLLNDIDFSSEELQISENKHIRIEFRDELLSLEVYVGV